MGIPTAIAVMSLDNMREVELEALYGGVHDFIPKPVKWEKLISLGELIMKYDNKNPP